MLIISTPLIFDWDSGNLEKNFLKHKVSNLEAEEIFANEPVIISEDPPHSQTEKRYMLWGRTNTDRKLTAVFTMRKEKVRIISVRDMNKKERRSYEKEIIINT